MAGEISDKRFKEVLRLLKFAVIKVGENTNEIALLRKDIEKNSRDLRNLKKKFVKTRARSPMRDSEVPG